MAASTLQRSNTPVVISFVFISVVILISALFAFSDPPSSFPHYTHGGTKVFYEKDTGRTGLLAMQRRVGWSQAALLLGLVGAVLAAGKNSSSLRRWVGPALLGLLLLDQRLHLSAINPTQPARVYEAKSPVIEFLKRQSPGSRFYSHRSHVPAYYLARTRFRRGTDGKVIDSFYRHLTPNSALLAGLYDAGGYGELDLAGRSEPGLNPAGLKMLASRGVRYVVTLKEEVPKGVKAIFGSAEVAVFEIRSMPYQSIAKDGAGKWMLLRRESYYPGWAGFVNGRRVPVHRAEGIFQGLEWEGAEKSKTKNQTRDRKRDHGTMGPWDHRASNDEVGRQFGIPNSRVPVVEFVFEPLSFRVGLAVSLAALLILIAMSVFACTQKRQFTGSSD